MDGPADSRRLVGRRRVLAATGLLATGLFAGCETGYSAPSTTSETGAEPSTSPGGGQSAVRTDATLVADDGDPGDRFGDALSVAGDAAILSAPGDADPNGTEEHHGAAGAAYAFERTDGVWHQAQKLDPDDGDPGDQFGTAVAVSGDIALVGAANDEDPNGAGVLGNGAGAAYVFERADGEWGQAAKLAAEDGDRGDAFGAAVALADGTAIVGAPRDEDPNGGKAGAAYVFEHSNGEWTQAAKLAAADGDVEDRLGESVAIADGVAVVGALGDEDPNGDGAGAAYVFERSDGEWTQASKLVADDGDAMDRFGEAVAISGDLAVVGATWDEDPHGESVKERGAGSVYVFERANGEWRQARKLAVGDVDPMDDFGAAVALREKTLLVGAPHAKDPNGNVTGSAYEFRRSDGSWRQAAKHVAEDDDEGGTFGDAVAIAGETALVAAPTEGGPDGDTGDVDGPGAAYVVDLGE